MKLEGWHFVIVIALALLLFGAPRLPGLARSAGQSLRIFRSEVRQMKDENPAPSADAAGAPPAAAYPAVPHPVPAPAPTPVPAPETPAPVAHSTPAPPAPVAPEAVQKGHISGT